MDVPNKTSRLCVIIVNLNEDEKSNNSTACLTTATNAVGIQVINANETEVETSLETAYRDGGQPIAVFFIIQNQLKEPTIALVKQLSHKYPLVVIVFLVPPNEEESFSASLPQYVLMGVNYVIRACESTTMSLFLKDISRTVLLKSRERTVLAGSTTNISHIPIGQDVGEYQKFQTQEKYLQSILPKMNIAVIATDKTGKIELWNKKAENYFGISERTALGSQISAIATDSWRAIVLKIEIEMGKSHMPVLQLRNEFLSLKSDRDFYADINVSYLANEDEQEIGTLYLLQDVTLMREVDKAKTEFVSLAAHQLRTPTSTINWFAQTLLKGKVTAELNASQKEYVLQIEESSRRMSKLVNTLLDASRLELGTFSIAPEKVNPRELLGNIIGQFHQAALNKKITVTQTIAHGFPDLVSWDPNLFHIMVENLISNAIKYTPDKGVVAINVKRSEDPVLGDSMLVVVHDTGYGIPKNQQEKIFTKLFRSDNIVSMDTDGTGLGLYLVKTIANKIGARVWFESPSSYSYLQAEDVKSSKKQNSKQYPGTDFYLAISLSDMLSKEGNKHLGE